MIVIDATPLCLPRPRGVAHALRALLEGLAPSSCEAALRVLLPEGAAQPAALPTLRGVLRVGRAGDSPRVLRSRLPALLQDCGASLYLSPWTALPNWDGPMIAWVHELPYVRLGPIEGRLRTLRQRRHVARLERRAAGIVVPSLATRDDLVQQHPALGARVRLIPNGFDPAPFEAAAHAGTGTYAVIVGTGTGAAGRRKKGMDLVPALRAGLAPLDLVVVGEAHASPGAVREAIARARVLLHPARSEGFGYPLLEAMAAGVPVVTSDGGALPETAGEAARVVPAGDVDAMLAAAHELAAEGPTRQTLIEAGRVRARAFHPQRVAAQWAEMFKSLARQPA